MTTATAVRTDRAGSRLPRTGAWQRLVSNANPDGVEDFYGAKRIPLALIDPNPHQPRKGPLRRVPELAASIRANDQLQPIVVNPPVNGRYTLVAGARRIAAFEWLQANDEHPGRWLQIVAIEKDTATNRRLVEALTENLSREALTGPEIIAALSVLRDLYQWNQTEMAKQLGVSQAWISQAFSVAGDPVLSEHVQTNGLSVAKAYEIVTAGSERTRDTALRAALGGAPRRLVRLMAKNGLGGDATESAVEESSPTDDPHHVGDSATEDRASGAPSRRADRQQGTRQHSGAAGAPGAGSPAARVATASADAGVRDLAELAAAFGVTGKWRDLQLVRLIQDALTNDTERFDAASFLRLARRDIRHVEALVRAAAVEGPVT